MGDFRSRVPIGYDTDRPPERTSRGSATIGSNGGRREFTLAQADIPSHTHSCDHDHGFTFAHTHTVHDHSHTQSHTHSIADHDHTMAHTHGMSHTHDFTDDNTVPNSAQTTDRDCNGSPDWTVWTGSTSDSTTRTTGDSSNANTGAASTATTSSGGPSNTGSNSDTTGTKSGTTSADGARTTSGQSAANTGGNTGSTSDNGAQTTSAASSSSGTTSEHTSTTGSWGGTPNDVNLDPESVTVNFMIKCTDIHNA